MDPVQRSRLDKALVDRGLVATRSRAAQLIQSGAVTVDGHPADRPAQKVLPEQEIALQREDPWVSRAAHKLLGALEACPAVSVAGRRCLDAGASTGGFTQVLLSRGAEQVVAVDVGHGQLAPALREDPRVENHEGLNLRNLEPGRLGAPFDLIVADLSFISLQLVMAPLARQAQPGGDLLMMVKPQFEVGRERLARTGVVTSPPLRREAVAGVAGSAVRAGLGLESVHRSALAGQDGNLEFFLHLRRPLNPPPQGRAESQAVMSEVDSKLGNVDFGDKE